MARRAGILVHPTSLPGARGMGDLGPDTTRFVDWAAEAGLTIWQVLPLGPLGGGQSPYASSSTFAGNPLLCSLDRLVRGGWLAESLVRDAPFARGGHIDFPRVLPWKAQALRESWHCFKRTAGGDAQRTLEAFVENPDHGRWLEDWALYAALKRHHGGRAWTDWDPELAGRSPFALERAARELAGETAYQRYLQCLFHVHWDYVRRRAHQAGITIVGDLPFYVDHDSADVWAHRELFQLDEAGRPLKVAGVPPDYFSEDGQLWGNPLYRWDRLAERGFDWWIDRLEANLRRADVVRLDHFRAFASYWEIDAGAETAIGGRWVPGPGDALFEAARQRLGRLPFIAEDLGDITPDVNELRERLGLPGMKILQFGLEDRDSEHHPSRHIANAVVYTGTHDNAPVRGWFDALEPEARDRVRNTLGGTHDDDVAERVVDAAYASSADICIVPLQDFLGLGGDARMNLPGTSDGNWGWRAANGALTLRLARRLRDLGARHGRGSTVATPSR